MHRSEVAERLTAQLLAGEPARTPVEVVERLLAVQAQDRRGFRLAIRARTHGLTAADVDRALTDRSLVVSWLNRGTLHLVRAEDYGWLHALTTPPLLNGNLRRLELEGIDEPAAERAVEAIVRALADDGPLTRKELGERVGPGLTANGALQLVMRACLRGEAVRGPLRGNEHAYVLVRDWLGAAAPVDRDLALTELARRYLAGHGPADERDLAKWAGIGLRDARRGLKAVAPNAPKAAPGPELPPPRLLGAFDPLLLGWASRAFVVGSAERVVTNNGLFRPIALVEGRAAGLWSLDRGEVVLEPFGRLTAAAAAALTTEAADIVRFLGVS